MGALRSGRGGFDRFEYEWAERNPEKAEKIAKNGQSGCETSSARKAWKNKCRITLSSR